MISMQKIFTFGIASVWMINGLLCKLLDLVPRHQRIVSKILGNENAQSLTYLIGMSEMALAIWIIMGFHRKWTAILQILLILTMNIIEFLVAPELLLWGQFNIIFALLFSSIIYFSNFCLINQRNEHVR